MAKPLISIHPPAGSADAIVILSGGHFNDGTLNQTALQRTVTAVRLFRANVASLMLFTGGPCCGHSTSALMADLAHDLGVPRSSIFLEEKATRTHDSALQSRAVLRAKGMESILLVTSTLHTLRARLAFEKAGLQVVGILAWNPSLFGYSSVSGRFELLSDLIHEYTGLVYYRFHGWI